jgi:hypothetical protein
MTSKLFASLTAAGLLAALPAQNCTDNQYRVYLVDSHGVVAPSTTNPVTGLVTYQFATEAVFLAFDPTLPSGTYYVHVTDPIGGGIDEVLSMNDPLDRFVSVTNNGGVITLSLPFTNGQNPPVFGLGLNGVGQSILVAPFRSSINEPCRFKAWYGDSWDLGNGPENPYLLRGGFDPVLNRCRVRSYENFTVGDGNGNDVFGSVFLDTDRDGVRDPGEAGVPGIQVRLGNGTTTLTQLTGNDGGYRFVDVAHGSWTVDLVLGSGSPYIATTVATRVVLVHGCADVAVADFGVAPGMLACNGHTIGFWRNNQGRALVLQLGVLATLPALNLVDASGQYVAPATTQAWASWLQGANATNMAYMLSAQLAAMHCNVLAGFVDPQAMVNGGSLGNLTIGNLMQQAIQSLGAHPYTPSDSPFRAAQEALKTALDRANNNLNWL